MLLGSGSAGPEQTRELKTLNNNQHSPTATPGHAKQAGNILVVSAPSGAGKTSLLRAVMKRDPGLGMAVSTTTRAARPEERDGVHYHFVDEAAFQRLVDEHAFVEHAQVFGNRYGTSEAALRAVVDSGRDLVLEIDWQGARQARDRFLDSVGIFILPPSLAALEQRLRGRASDGEQVIAGRMAQALNELSHWSEYDYLIVNDDFDEAVDALCGLIAGLRLRTAVQSAMHADLLKTLVPA